MDRQTFRQCMRARSSRRTPIVQALAFSQSGTGPKRCGGFPFAFRTTPKLSRPSSIGSALQPEISSAGFISFLLVCFALSQHEVLRATPCEKLECEPPDRFGCGFSADATDVGTANSQNVRRRFRQLVFIFWNVNPASRANAMGCFPHVLFTFEGFPPGTGSLTGGAPTGHGLGTS